LITSFLVGGQARLIKNLPVLTVSWKEKSASRKLAASQKLQNSYIMEERLEEKARGFIDPGTRNSRPKTMPSNIMGYFVCLPPTMHEFYYTNATSTL
jgi:hypothetical protein